MTLTQTETLVVCRGCDWTWNGPRPDLRAEEHTKRSGHVTVQTTTPKQETKP